MSYDRELAARLREVLADQPDLSEKAMFGGLAFLVNGKMAVAAGGQGSLMVRVDPVESEAMLADGVQRMVMNGRELAGWLLVSSDTLTDDAVLDRWAAVGVSYALTLPPT